MGRVGGVGRPAFAGSISGPNWFQFFGLEMEENPTDHLARPPSQGVGSPPPGHQTLKKKSLEWMVIEQDCTRRPPTREVGGVNQLTPPAPPQYPHKERRRKDLKNRRRWKYRGLGLAPPPPSLHPPGWGQGGRGLAATHHPWGFGFPYSLGIEECSNLCQKSESWSFTDGHT